MKQQTLTLLALSVFGLVVLSFIIRGFSQFIVGPRTATLLAGPLIIVAACLLLSIIGYWVLSLVGLTTIDHPE